ncbi:hypothetical protein MKW98_017879 [Papaver atlanticum]|uniref:GTD-binding domain-containing protein n=1 Tax=Papaver atlanticum TaxID=357466 RepID=A0AAD4TF51_9MAGN|nr:hypothetical protein MKW98_017879 [Papaver atlanticum]
MASKSSSEHVEQQLGNPSKKKEQQLTKIPHFLIYVILFFMIHLLIYIILQWIIIIVLFLNGLIAFIASEFARFFDLRIPCFLCTRFDHVLLKKNLYYNDSMCEDHRKEVSSMVFCHIHQRISDIRLMCEGCLHSSNTGNKSSFGSCKPMQGLFGVDTDHLHLPNGEYERYLKVEKGVTLQCSCCGQPQGVEVSSSTKLVQKSVSHVGDFPPTPSPSPRIIASVKTDEARAFDELSHVQYSELNIMSDADSEIPDDEFRSNALTHESQGKEDMKAATAPLLPEVEDLNEEPCKSPNFLKGSRFYGFPGLDSGTASPAWPPKIPVRSPGEKADSVAESVEGISTNEADVETVLHRLKRQVRLDRKTLMAMYMELDEERSSSAVAANQAMAMITRLQAEKAAIQLEALQYQRIMEEQAEYDQQALQVMKDLLNKREEIIKAMEAELRSFRGLGKHDAHDGEGHGTLLNDGYQDSSFEVELSTRLCDDYSYNVNEEGGENDTGPSQVENPEAFLLDFEGERLFLMDQLKILEKKIQSPDLDDAIQSLPSNLKYEDRGEGSNINISKAISHLHEKLTGLETDKEFLKHTLPSLQKGDEGTQLLREIAKHLWYLRHTYNMPSEGVTQ